MINLEDELVHEYLAECCDHLANVETDLLAIARDGEKFDDEQMNRVFRAVHSVKGGAGFFALTNIRDLAHRAEDLLARLRARDLPVSQDRIQVLLRATDQLQTMIQNAAQSDSANIAGTLFALAAAGEAPKEKSASAVRPKRILLAEDDLTSRIIMQKALFMYGECHTAVNGKEAVAAFQLALDQGQPYDLIFMDIMMPEMDGREAVRQVRAVEESRGVLSSSGVKIIMITALDDVKNVSACFRELCDAYLTKPVDLARLRECIQVNGLV